MSRTLKVNRKTKKLEIEKYSRCEDFKFSKRHSVLFKASSGARSVLLKNNANRTFKKTFRQNNKKLILNLLKEL